MKHSLTATELVALKRLRAAPNIAKHQQTVNRNQTAGLRYCYCYCCHTVKAYSTMDYCSLQTVALFVQSAVHVSVISYQWPAVTMSPRYY